MRAVFPEGEAQCFGETSARACLEPPSQARPQRLAGSLGRLQSCFGVIPQNGRNKHTWPPSLDLG